MTGFVSHTHSHLGGECPHRCTYCYVGRMQHGRPAKYCGPIRIVPQELSIKYGTGRVVFIENCNDLFAASIPDEMIRTVLAHCCQYPDNTYLFHTKNPGRIADYLSLLPPDRMLGVTAETNRTTKAISTAPDPLDRLAVFGVLPGPKRITVEPIMDFDLDVFLPALLAAKPDNVVIGADSKGAGLPEPSGQKIYRLLVGLRAAGIDVREKSNLRRLLP